MNNFIGKRIYAIQSYSQTNHIKLCAGITLDTRRITDVAQYLMRKSLLQLLRCPLKSLYLATRKGIKLFGITSHQMREYGTRNNSRLLFQAFYQLRYLIRCKAEPMHAGIQFDVNGEIGHSFFFGSLYQFIQ